MESINRDHYLKIPLSSENIGFKLLSKMGYRPDDGIGKKNKSNIEPISFSIKSDRKGIGHANDMLIKYKALQSKKLKLDLIENKNLVNEYIQSSKEKLAYKKLKTLLEKSKRICNNLEEDTQLDQDITVPNNINGNLTQPIKESNDDFDELYDKERFTDSEIDDQESEEELTIESMEKKFENIIAYMRTTYNYCFWCGVKYNHFDDMESNCPGLTEDEH
ncbi:unnamed protein product [Gordionus sp. m RMFG-2023]